MCLVVQLGYLMNLASMNDVQQFVQEHMNSFHESRYEYLDRITLTSLLERVNAYLFQAKHTIITVSDLIIALLDAQMSEYEERIFEDFLKALAMSMAQRTLNAVESASTGIDFEYAKDKKHCLVSVKLDPNWGNSSQWRALENNFENASRVLRQSVHVDSVDCVLGICYGKSKATINAGIITQVCGQSFWYMVSGDKSLYTEIVDLLGHRVKERESFDDRKARIINRFTRQFFDEFCDESGDILWEELVRFNSQNLTEEDKTMIEKGSQK